MDIGAIGLLSKRRALLASRSAVYILIVVLAVVTAYAYKLRTEGIFSCQADGYTPDRYLAYCNGADFGDYEHGVFWFEMDPQMQNFARNAEVLFLGSSRLQIAFSTAATAEWFSSLSARYYLLGFGYDENLGFTEPLLRKLHPQAQVYVINVDGFFDQSETPPAKIVMGDPDARNRYENKRQWQNVHELVCKTIPAICGDSYVVFRSRETGTYNVNPGKFKIKPVSYNPFVDQKKVKTEIASANDFLSHLPVKSECIILTMVPAVETNLESAKAVASALGLDLLAPEPLGLQTMDESHLDKRSAERWSNAFFQMAGARILKCLNSSQKPHS
jgi:hypothetical protein